MPEGVKKKKKCRRGSSAYQLTKQALPVHNRSRLVDWLWTPVHTPLEVSTGVWFPGIPPIDVRQREDDFIAWCDRAHANGAPSIDQQTYEFSVPPALAALRARANRQTGKLFKTPTLSPSRPLAPSPSRPLALSPSRPVIEEALHDVASANNSDAQPTRVSLDNVTRAASDDVSGFNDIPTLGNAVPRSATAAVHDDLVSASRLAVESRIYRNVVGEADACTQQCAVAFNHRLVTERLSFRQENSH